MLGAQPLALGRGAGAPQAQAVALTLLRSHQLRSGNDFTLQRFGGRQRGAEEHRGHREADQQWVIFHARSLPYPLRRDLMQIKSASLVQYTRERTSPSSRNGRMAPGPVLHMP